MAILAAADAGRTIASVCRHIAAENFCDAVTHVVTASDAGAQDIARCGNGAATYGYGANTAGALVAAANAGSLNAAGSLHGATRYRDRSGVPTSLVA